MTTNAARYNKRLEELLAQGKSFADGYKTDPQRNIEEIAKKARRKLLGMR